MVMKVNGSTGVTFPDSTTMTSGTQACKAWVNFNGTGTVAIRASGNVTSVTDNGTGDYTVNFTNAMPDSNYAAVLGSEPDISGQGGSVARNTTVAATTTALRLTASVYNSGVRDFEYIDVAIFR